jgi:hypothetical protein
LGGRSQRERLGRIGQKDPWGKGEKDKTREQVAKEKIAEEDDGEIKEGAIEDAKEKHKPTEDPFTNVLFTTILEGRRPDEALIHLVLRPFAGKERPLNPRAPCFVPTWSSSGVGGTGGW